MKKLTIAIFMLIGTISMASAELGINVGVSAQIGKMDASATEGSTTSLVRQTETGEVLFGSGSFFIEKELSFLAIDHKFGGGSKERKIIGEIYSYYENIIKNIKKYQILCHNCNVGKWMNKGKCPHKDAHV